MRQVADKGAKRLCQLYLDRVIIQLLKAVQHITQKSSSLKTQRLIIPLGKIGQRRIRKGNALSQGNGKLCSLIVGLIAGSQHRHNSHIIIKTKQTVRNHTLNTAR